MAVDAQVSVDERTGAVTMTWNDPEDAVQVGHVLTSAGLNQHGKVVDRGFYGDGHAIIAAVAAWEQRKAGGDDDDG